MGSSLNNDKNVRIYMSLNKAVFYAGQALQGTVHIDCLEQSPYRYLSIFIDGREQCYWSESRGQDTVYYQNQRNTYHAGLNLAQFNLGIQRGQYNFPFSILLPRAIPASLYICSRNYIHYEISAFLHAYDNQSAPQIYKRSLHIRQPPRRIPRLIKNQNVQHSKCCGCSCGCCYCGSVRLSLQSDINYVDCDKIFHVKGAINNLNGQINIKNYKVVLRQSVKRIQQYSNSMITEEDIVLYDTNKPVPKGTQQSFQCEVKVPPQFVGYTAIGNIIYRTYYLAIVAEACYCLSNPTLVAANTVVVNSSVSVLQAHQEIQLPVGWNPVTVQPLAFLNMAPYFYNPSPLVEFKVRNQDGHVVSGMMEQMPMGTDVRLLGDR